MKISTKGRYGLMLLVDLAMHETGSPVSLKSIAERQGLSEHYLEQLIAPLRNAGYVRSIRGAYGGYVLAKPKTEITAADIILTLEGPLHLVDEDVEDGLDELWERLRQAILSVLKSVTLQDLVEMKESGADSYMYYI
ncbi:RrF2 family transcriptional regulator [Alicyclobacillus macrosporangiidus]|uniref:Rrf2 family transcriptional regulator, cysteine metabolism repressor n=1 Tax=Alicyclobacillus macrosporangiidus TaxID=392015 RepID=A0A1I7K9V6_9BACL|nr:Rrf2 family transcriptional regulator [Alicyclobacillus macrosporangiidus]SFU94191.1 Rrf2 family transcriptional regulator, cysteine metabolism repressor [Alicyclobacillus macrosporangiidus]